MSQETTTIQTESLSDKVQSFRDKAREILRMQNINRVLQDKFYVGTDAKSVKEMIKADEKELERIKYKITKLDEENPDYEDLLKFEENRLKRITEALENKTEQLTKIEKADEKRLKEIKEKIEKIESGEIKVNINDVNEITNRMINKYTTNRNSYDIDEEDEY